MENSFLYLSGLTLSPSILEAMPAPRLVTLQIIHLIGHGRFILLVTDSQRSNADMRVRARILPQFMH